MAELSACNWIRQHPCGTGKAWLGCALGQQAARSELTVLLCNDGNGRFPSFVMPGVDSRLSG
jgi:hypothetical protein